MALYDIFDDDNNLYLVMEYIVDGTIYSEWKGLGSYGEMRAAEVIADICKAIKKLHSCSVIHRDLKLENIMHSFGVVKVADFGCAVHSFDMRRSMVGTPSYLSPEQLSHE